MIQTLVRALQYLHDRADTMATASKDGRRKLQAFIEEYDLKSYWQYYREVLASLHHLKQFNSESIDQLINEYAENAAHLEKKLSRSSAFFILEWFGFDESVDELHYVLNDIRNNTGNFLYQIKINIE